MDLLDKSVERFGANDGDGVVSVEKPATFTVKMRQSNVVKTFWLTVPRKFSNKHLASGDQMVTLQDSEGKTWQTKFLSKHTGFSGGWGQFARDHSLGIGDILVFQMIDSNTFWVQIRRASDTSRVIVKAIETTEKACTQWKENPAVVNGPLPMVLPRNDGRGKTEDPNKANHEAEGESYKGLETCTHADHVVSPFSYESGGNGEVVDNELNTGRQLFIGLYGAEKGKAFWPPF